VAVLVASACLAGLALFSFGTRAQANAQANGQPAPNPSTGGSLDAQGAQAFFDELVPGQLRDGHVAGATVAVVEDGRLLFAKGYGYADLEEREPVMAEETLFYPGSAGKLFTWTAVMQLAEEGELDLHADVDDYLDFEIPDTYPQPITVADLMTHTAGFEEQYTAQLAGGRADVLPLREFLVRNVPERVYPPGEVYAYSNYGTALAGYIVERVSGEPYEGYVTNHILRPLGMDHSAAVQPLPPPLERDLSKGYHHRDGAYEAKGFEWVSNAPSAPLHATATDMAKFMLSHLQDGEFGGRRILKESTAVEMHSRQFTQDLRLPGTAYGFINSRANGRRILLHDGESARFSSLVALLPEEDVGLFVSYNTPYEPYETLSAFMDRFYPHVKTGPRIENFPDEAKKWTGTYVPARVAYGSPQKVVGWLDPLEVRAEDGHLLVDSPFGRQRYAATGPGSFEQTRGEWSLVFEEGTGEGRTGLFMGPFPLAYFEAPYYRTLGFQLPVGLACLALLLSTLVVFPVAFLLRRHRGGGKPPLTARLAGPLAAATALLNAGLLVWFLLSLVGFGETYVWPTQAVSAITRLWLLSVPLTLGLVSLAALAWWKRYWGLAGRVHYALVALASVLFVWILGNWNLIGL
jgi:CubicO group peptidase (beta-lactamase class C family)